MAIKVAVFNQKGGVGKTTLSVILTQIALMHKKRVLAVDQDEQNNFNVSVSYMQKDTNFKDLFTFKTILTEKDFDSNVDWIIIDCPPAFNERSRFAIKNSDFILIPVRPDSYSTMPFTRLRTAAGDYKKTFQFPIVKVGFTDNVASREANKKIETLRAMGYTVIMDVPLHAKISANISSGLKKLWCVGLSDMARQPFESVYKRLELLHGKLQELRQKNSEWKNNELPDYIDDPDNPDAAIFGRK